MDVKVWKVGAKDGRPANIDIGKVYIGFTTDVPIVGHRFNVVSHTNYFTSSPVTKILPGNKFETENSIYQWELIRI